jgi:hypothetical protein
MPGILLTSFIEGAPAPNIKRLCNGEYDLDNYILFSGVAPDTTDGDVHALCTKPAVLKMEESRKSSRGFRKKPSNNRNCTY